MTKTNPSLLPSILKIMAIFLISLVFIFSVLLIFLRISIKGKTVIVPDVTGKSLVEATQILRKAGLGQPRIEGEKYSGNIPKGYIVEQRPSPGSKVKSGRQVKIFLSKGAEAGIVPRLVGKTVIEAEAALSALGLEVGSIVRVHSDDFPQEGTVIAHTPTQNASVEKGTKINLLVSLGPYYSRTTMPDIIGMKLSDAVDFLKSRGIKLGSVERRPSTEVDERDIILDQTPRPGEQIRQGTVVNVVVSSNR